MGRKSTKPQLSAEQKEFAKVKRFIQKRFPGAHTVARQEKDGKIRYQVVDGEGFAASSKRK